MQEKERHLTGQELCQAIREFAIEQYGYMALTVLNSWGVKCTGDFGEIVYNLIDIEQMRKTKDDRREDFDDVYDFKRHSSKNSKSPAVLFRITTPSRITIMPESKTPAPLE